MKTRILVFLAVFLLTTGSGFPAAGTVMATGTGTQIVVVFTLEATDTPLDIIDGAKVGGTITDTAIHGG